jgi:uncharacterized surface anchored protein
MKRITSLLLAAVAALGLLSVPAFASGGATNYPLNSIVIKVEDAVTHRLLGGARFEIYFSNEAVSGGHGTLVATVDSDSSGVIIISGIPSGYYIVRQTAPPTNYQLSITNEQHAFIKPDGTSIVELVFSNYRYGGLLVLLNDSDTGLPVSGASFSVTDVTGKAVGTSANGIYFTDSRGEFYLENLPAGDYVITQLTAAQGYAMDSNPNVRTVRLQHTNADQSVFRATFSNSPLGTLLIRLRDSASKAPIAGAVFNVRMSGGADMGSFTTGADGSFSLPRIARGTYIISQVSAPSGYLMANTPQTQYVGYVNTFAVDFENSSIAGLQILKINSNTRQPISGVMFSVSKMNGERIGEFTTGNDGIIYIPGLEPGWYTVVETRAADGYILDNQPRNVEVKTDTPATLTFENTPMGGLLIVKTDEATGEPLAGVKFEVKKSNGEQVGIYTTDQSGRIYVNNIPAGKYVVVETAALSGYELDSTAREVTVNEGRQAVMEITNRQKAGLRLLKIDSVTKRPIFGVEFMVFDSNNKVVGTYITDNNGLIDFAGILTEGRYTLRETRAAPGYYRDDMPRTVEFVSGRVTEVVWENTPQMGQIQITKLSGDDNQVNGLPRGTPLAGAVFEVYDHRTGNLLDRFQSGTDGRAVSKPLPLGRYTVKEVQAPQWYKLSAEALDIEIEFATQIIRREFLNFSANTGVTIRKTGNVETMSGDVIGYTIQQVRNDSTVPLTDFYWRDVLPTEAVRLDRIVTGTYNQALRYKIIATTNKGDTRVIADNLSTTVNNVVNCNPVALGLRNDEFITGFTLVFGTVRAGFTQVTQPQVFVRVLSNLPNGMEFANRVDVGGKYGGEWVIGNAVWVTKIWARPQQLPRTGF